MGRILSQASSHEQLGADDSLTGAAVKRVIEWAMKRAGLETVDLSHVNAHGLSTVADDQFEAKAIHDTLGDVPVTALKSFFGYLGAGTGAVELAASVLALERGEVPLTLNYDTPDAACPVNVVHGEPLRTRGRAVLKISASRLGHAAALAIAAD